MNNVTPKYDILAKMVAEFEGFKTHAYKDTGGIWTIGIGSTYNYNLKRKVQEGDVITLQDAINWSQFEFSEVVRQANHYITKPLTWNQATAICDMIYNRGIGNFLKTRLDELINSDPENPEVLKEIIGTGLRDRLGNLLNGLIRRRKSEAYLYQTGLLKFKF